MCKEINSVLGNYMKKIFIEKIEIWFVIGIVILLIYIWPMFIPAGGYVHDFSIGTIIFIDSSKNELLVELEEANSCFDERIVQLDYSNVSYKDIRVKDKIQFSFFVDKPYIIDNLEVLE